MTVCSKTLEAEVAKDAPLWFLFSILICSSWLRHRLRFAHWETIGVLGDPAMFAASHFATQILEVGCSLVISSACVMILGVRQDFVNEQTQF